MKHKLLSALLAVAMASGAAQAQTKKKLPPQPRAQVQAPTSADKKPNILVIMGDDVGWFNIGAYHRGIMSGKTPNLDKLANEGMMFTDYYAEASCTAGRANFITGELPIRTGMTTVGQAGADIGIPDEAVTLATVLKAQGYAAGQFGKNHLGDRNKFLPTVHGFDEFFGYLYHLDAMSDPYWYDYPQDWLDKTGPRNLVHSFATETDDPTEMPRWGRVGKQKIIDEGPLAPFPNMKDMQSWQEGRKAKYDMETFDDVLVKSSSAFMDKAKKAGKPFFVWHNTTRMHVFTYIPPKYQAMMNAKDNYGLEEAGMAQLDDSVGALLKHVEDIGEADNTIVIFTTDNGAEVFTWPDGGMTPFKATKGTIYEGGFRVPAIIRWPGKVKPRSVENGIFSGLDWLPTLAAATTAIDARMPGDLARADRDLVDEALDQDVAKTIGGRRRIIVHAIAHQRGRGDLRRALVAGLEGQLGQSPLAARKSNGVDRRHPRRAARAGAGRNLPHLIVFAVPIDRHVHDARRRLSGVSGDDAHAVADGGGGDVVIGLEPDPDEVGPAAPRPLVVANLVALFVRSLHPPVAPYYSGDRDGTAGRSHGRL